MLDFLQGKKTYVSGIGMVLMGIGGYLTGKVDAVTSIQSIITGFGFIFLRKAISGDLPNSLK